MKPSAIKLSARILLDFTKINDGVLDSTNVPGSNQLTF